MAEDLQNPSNEDLQGNYISPDQLCIGLYVHLDLGWMQHPFTFSNFKIKDEEQIRKIRALGLTKIRYAPARSDVAPKAPKAPKVTPAARVQPTPPPNPSAPPEPATPLVMLQRPARLKQLNKAIIESDQAFSKSATVVREAVRNLSFHPEHSRGMAEQVVNDMVNSVITESAVALLAISSTTLDYENFVHPLNVTVLSLMLAKSLDMKEEDAALLGMAAMFHDVGKEETPRNKSFIDLHCEIGARIAQRSGLPERVSTVIQQHHEFIDGSGYPAHIRNGAIDPLASLLAMVNYYDNLCNPPTPADALTPYEALSKMYVNQPEKFDPTMLKTLVKSLGVYPPGSIVQLSNELYGIVLTANPNKPLLPLVMIYVPGVARETPIVIDLAEENHLTIKKCLRPDLLPREIFDYLRPRKHVSYYFLKKEDAYAELTESETGHP